MGDCKQSQCDGAGTIVSANDDADVGDDNKACTTDTCNAGTAVHTPKAAGTTCGAGLVCDAVGDCLGCNQPSDCPGADTTCETRTCTAGMCGFNYAAAGTAAGTQATGDCHKSQCDGAGVIVNAVDDTDVPVDSKQCTSDVCTNGVVSNPPLAAGTACSQNGGTTCDATGSCVQCLLPSECGASTACKSFTCVAGACGQVNTASGVVAANPTAGDCRTDKCDGAGNILTNQIDNGDLPADDGNQCTGEVCVAGVAQHPNQPQNSACTQNGGTFCASGSCVQCVQASDCGASTACHTFTCVAGLCGGNDAPSGTVVTDPTPGDCKSNQCNGSGALVTGAADDSDLPVDDGNQCTGEACSAGTATHPVKASGTACSQGGGTTCDGAGTCVACTLDSQCPTGGPCQAPKCGGGACGFVAGPALVLPAGSQTAGNCQSLTCDGASQTPVSVADNADLPADDGNQCTTEACTAGVPGTSPTASGTACSQMGGTTCDGAGTCVSAPSVTMTAPADGATAAATTTIAVSFSAAMNPATLTGQTALGACSGSIQVSLDSFATCVAFATAAPTMNASNTMATFTPQPGLLVNRTYKIRVTTAAASATSVALPAAYTSATGFGTTNPLASSTGVVISQVYGGGGNAGSIYKNDFIELHNRGNVAVNVGGWAVQYVSGTGTGAWTTTAIPAGIIMQPGRYLLVQEAAGAGGTTNLPTPEVIGTIAMGGTAAKVALTNTTTALTGQCPSGAALVDFVGLGANCSEGSTTGATSAQMTNTASASRNLSACTDTNVNSVDFTTGAVVPRNSATSSFWCSAPQNESGAALEADYCATQFPLSLSAQAGTTQTVYGRIYEAGTTEAAGGNASVTAQLGYGPTTANPEYEAGWSWLAATFNTQVGNNDEYQSTFTVPAAGAYRYGYRFSLDAGSTWTYCDNNQGDTGAGSNASLTFDLPNLGVLTATP